MKNSKIISILFVILFVVLGSNVAFADTGVVNTPALRIRESASKNSSIITRAYEDDEVEILGEEGDWYKVKVNDKTGYASKSLITRKENTSNNNENIVPNDTLTTDENKNETSSETTVNIEQSSEDSNNAEQAENNNSSVSTSKTKIKDDTVARIMPNFASNEYILLTKETEVEVVREINNWSEIVVEGRKVWVLKNKISIGNETPEETQPEQTDSEQNTVEDNNVVNNTVISEDNTNTATNENNVTNNNTVDNTDTNNTTTSESRNTKGIINVETANVREKASKSSKIVYRLDEFDEVTIVEEDGDWYKITNSKGENGYVSKSLVKIADVSSRGNVDARAEIPEEVKTEEPEMDKGIEVVNYAKQYLGCEYVLGGKTPESGFDCSGYTRYVYKNFGYNIGTVAAEQTSVGAEIAREDLKEGDLILFYNEANTKIGHTGIYIGNNEFIHSANPERGVVTDNLVTNSYYSTRFVTARRIVE